MYIHIILKSQQTCICQQKEIVWPSLHLCGKYVGRDTVVPDIDSIRGGGAGLPTYDREYFPKLENVMLDHRHRTRKKENESVTDIQQ